MFAGDFQKLLRNHFNQILRLRRSVPPKSMDRIQMPIGSEE